MPPPLSWPIHVSSVFGGSWDFGTHYIDLRLSTVCIREDLFCWFKKNRWKPDLKRLPKKESHMGTDALIYHESCRFLRPGVTHQMCSDFSVQRQWVSDWIGIKTSNKQIVVHQKRTYPTAILGCLFSIGYGLIFSFGIRLYCWSFTPTVDGSEIQFATTWDVFSTP